MKQKPQERVRAVERYKKLKNQPLKFVLAEFRFSQVLKIADYIPELQDALRKEYPIFENKKEQMVSVHNGNLEVLHANRWAFISANHHNSIDISSDRIMFSTSAYPRFEGFAERCRNAIDILIQKVSPQLLTRVGLRYGDLVQVTKGEGETFEKIVDEHFIFPQALSSLGKPNTQRCEVVLQTSSGVLLVRTLYGTHDLTCLPDVQGLSISIDNEPKLSERMILDFDHFWEAKEESVRFETDIILTKLGSLHETSREAFWKITTDYARNEKWD